LRDFRSLNIYRNGQHTMQQHAIAAIYL